jgi:hypothetical protein
MANKHTTDNHGVIMVHNLFPYALKIWSAQSNLEGALDIREVR